MNITVRWHDKAEHIQLWTFKNHWTWEEFHQTLAETKAQIADCYPQRVDVIANIEDSGKIPANSMMHLQKAFDDIPDNLGIITICSSASLINTVIKIGKRIYPNLANRYYASPNIQSAVQLIKVKRNLIVTA